MDFSSSESDSETEDEELPGIIVSYSIILTLILKNISCQLLIHANI